MAEGTRSLTALVRWLSDRLILVPSLGPLGWPPPPEVWRALEEGREEDALHVTDEPGARYTVRRRLRPELDHLWVGTDRRLGLEVVIKLSRSSSHVARLLAMREARLTGALQHPGIVTICDADPQGRYIVVEKLDADLRDLPWLDPKWIIDAFCQAGHALADAHEQGIFHGDFRPENLLVRIKRDRQQGISRVWAKVSDFGHAVDARARHEELPVASAHAAKDLHDWALAFWECLTCGRRPPDGKELIPGWLHAVLDPALMLEPSQRWADLTALVDAIERGRETTAAVSRAAAGPNDANAAGPLELALAHAEDGLFALALQHWREVQRQLTNDPAELGRASFALAAAMFRAAERVSDATTGNGYRRCIDVLDASIRALSLASDLEAARDASTFAGRVCDAWKELYPIGSPEHHHLGELALAYRTHTEASTP